MKRLLAALAVASLLGACSSKSTTTTTVAAAPVESVAFAAETTVAAPETTLAPETTVAAAADEADDVTIAAPCAKSPSSTLVEMAVLITNNSSKPSDYVIEGVIEQDGVKVGDLTAYVENVPANGKAKDALTSLDNVEGEFTCRIVKVDRSEAV